MAQFEGLDGAQTSLDAAAAAAWAVANGSFALLLAVGTCATALALRGARAWRVATPGVRGAIADYGAVAAVVLWTAFSFCLTPYSPPPNVPRRLPVQPPWRDTSFWHTAASIGALPPWSIAAAALPASIIAVLFYFDHSVSAHVALAVLKGGGPVASTTTASPKPATYAYDLALLGVMTLVAGVTGLPPVNGVLPQVREEGGREGKGARREGHCSRSFPSHSPPCTRTPWPSPVAPPMRPPTRTRSPRADRRSN